jgi:phage baseplate assembly protein W
MVTDRAWRFELNPGELQPGQGGIALSAISKGVEMIGSLAAIRQAIVLLLFTEPGERVMRPDYGCPLRQLLFSTNNETLAGLVIHFAQRAITRWEPRVTDVQVSVRQYPEEPGAMEITIRYRERSTGQVDEIVYPIFLEGEGI